MLTKIVVTFDNLKQIDLDMIGRTKPIKAILLEDGLMDLEKIGEIARKAADNFGKMFLNRMVI